MSFYGYLNRDEEEEIQSLFYNKANDAFIICGSYNNQILKVRYVTLRCIEFGIFKGVDIIKSETIKFPGWLEYDDQEMKVLTYDHLSGLNLYSLYLLFGFIKYSILRVFDNTKGLKPKLT